VRLCFNNRDPTSGKTREAVNSDEPVQWQMRPPETGSISINCFLLHKSSHVVLLNADRTWFRARSACQRSRKQQPMASVSEEPVICSIFGMCHAHQLMVLDAARVARLLPAMWRTHSRIRPARLRDRCSFHHSEVRRARKPDLASL